MAENELVEIKVNVNKYMSINITFRKEMSLLDFVGTMKNANNLLKLSKDVVQAPIVENLGIERSESKVSRFSKLPRHDWTPEEDKIIVENFGKIPAKEIMNLLDSDDLNINKVKVRAYFLKKSKPVYKKSSRSEYKATGKSTSSIKNDSILAVYHDLLVGMKQKDIAKKRRLALSTVYNVTSKLKTEGYIMEA